MLIAMSVIIYVFKKVISIYNPLIANDGRKCCTLNSPWVRVFLKFLSCDLSVDFTK